MQLKLFISTFMIGYLATLIPNKKSNIHPLFALSHIWSSFC